MAIVKSIFLGSFGSYNILGTPVVFENHPPSESDHDKTQTAVSDIVNRCLIAIALVYPHMVAHELSHALTCRLLIGKVKKVSIHQDGCGRCCYPDDFKTAPLWKKSIVLLAGPMGGIAFSTCQLVAAAALRYYISWPVALVLGAGAVVGMANELVASAASIVKENGSDIGRIRKYHGNLHLGLACAALIAQTAFGVFAAIKLRA